MRLSELTERLAEGHRPVKRPDPCARDVEQYAIHCPACDDHARLWRPGDPEVTCELWRAAVELGVVTP